MQRKQPRKQARPAAAGNSSKHGGFPPQILSRPLSGSFRDVYFDIVIAGPDCTTVDTVSWNNW